MNKSVLIVIVLATALTAGLYTLPKVVVRNENKQLSSASEGGHATQTPRSQSRNAGSDSGAATGSSEQADVNQSEIHDKPIPAEQLNKIRNLESAFATAGLAEKEAAAEKLISLFREVTRYDSAAYYAGLLATAQPTEKNILTAGDQYFEAYTFAVDAKKTDLMGQKTRDFYQKALAKNPNLLSAKANMAMTYVNTDTPMQGIALLREVLQQEPTNELALFNLGLLSMRSNQYGRAIERFRQILVNNPTSRKAQFYLGVSLAEAGQKAEAKQVLAQVKAQEKDPQILAAIREYEDRLK